MGIYYGKNYLNVQRSDDCPKNFDLCSKKCSEESEVHFNTWKKENEIKGNALMNATDRAEWDKLVNEREQSKRNFHEKIKECSSDCLAKLKNCKGK